MIYIFLFQPVMFCIFWLFIKFVFINMKNTPYKTRSTTPPIKVLITIFTFICIVFIKVCIFK